MPSPPSPLSQGERGSQAREEKKVSPLPLGEGIIGVRVKIGDL